MGCTSHCRSGLVEMAVTVGMKLALEDARSVQKSWNKTERRSRRERAGAGRAGGGAFPCAACSRGQRGGRKGAAGDRSGLSIFPSPGMKGLPLPSKNSGAQRSAFLLHPAAACVPVIPSASLA